MHITSFDNGFGAQITSIDLNRMANPELAKVRQAWLDHQVISFPDQPLSHHQLEAVTLRFGEFGHEGHANILEVRREPNEQVAPFGSDWHSDWSFQERPPAATLLHAKVVPPTGGDTWYANGYAAFEALDTSEQRYLSELTAIHSARRPYSHRGFLAGGGTERSMTILPSDAALATQEHPLVRTHPETQRKALWLNQVYTIDIKELDTDEATRLINRLQAHCVEERFVYKHKWQTNMLTLWDNRCVQHFAQGGYDGHRRVMHRTTVAGDAPY